MKEQKLGNRGFISFVELERALNEFPNQTNGDSSSVCEIGVPYIAFHARGIARPGDEKTIERFIVNEMCEKLDEYFDGKSGRIYWRHRIEFDVSQHNEVLRLDVNGPDVDFITDQKCVMDKNWRKVHLYCRLVRAPYQTMALDAVRIKVA